MLLLLLNSMEIYNRVSIQTIRKYDEHVRNISRKKWKMLRFYHLQLCKKTFICVNTLQRNRQDGEISDELNRFISQTHINPFP